MVEGPSPAGRSNPDATIRNWLNDLFDGIARASVVGNSYGGFIALNQAALAPERIDRVVLISPAGGFVSVMPLFRSMIYQAL